jgi:hypothetical protein
MERQYIRDAQVIERYLQGKLSPAEEEQFEEAYLADPELLSELKLAERLRDGMKDLSDELRAAAPKPRARWRQIAASPSYGIAASLVAAAALLTSGTLLWQSSEFGGGASSFASVSRTRVLPLVSVRGASNPNTVAAPAADEWTVLLVDAGLGDYDRYTATLLDSSGRTLVSLDDLTPTPDGSVALGFPGRALAPGSYEVRLAGSKRDWPADRAPDDLSRTPLTVTPR